MDIRYAANPRDVKRYTTEELRNEFLIENLYQPDSVTAVYSHVDRMVTLGCMPVTETVSIDKGIDVWANFGTKFFLERREIGIFNIGGEGTIAVDGQGLPVYHHGSKRSAVCQQVCRKTCQVLHGICTCTPQLRDASPETG